MARTLRWSVDRRSPAAVVDLDTERAYRKPAATRFVVEARDMGTTPDGFRVAWSWYIEDSGAEGQSRPTAAMIGAQLRRIADRLDPTQGRKRGRRHYVRPRHG